MLEKLDSQVSCKIPTYLGTRPQFEAKKRGLTTGARSNTAQSVSQSVSQQERENRKTGFLSYVLGDIGQRDLFCCCNWRQE